MTRNGRPWARIVPELTQTGSDYLDQLIASGRAAMPTGSLADLPMPERIGAWDGRDAADVVSELREDTV